MRSPSSLRLNEVNFHPPRPTLLDVDNHRHAAATFLRHPIAYLLPDRVARWPHGRSEDQHRGSPAQHHRVRHGRFFAGTGISTRCPSTTPVGLALGPDLPRADEPGPGTLGQSADGFLTQIGRAHV